MPSICLYIQVHDRIYFRAFLDTKFNGMEIMCAVSTSEIQSKVSRVVTLLQSFGWSGTTVSSSSLVQQSMASGDPHIFINIFKFLIYHFWDDFGSHIVYLFKMRLPPDRAALEERNGEGRKTVVDHDQRANALAFMLGDKYSTTVKFRRVSKFAREVLGMHRTYLRECQFPKQVRMTTHAVGIQISLFFFTNTNTSTFYLNIR